MLISVEDDEGPAGDGLSWSFLSTLPTECPVPSQVGRPLLSGDIVVTDAQPLTARRQARQECRFIRAAHGRLAFRAWYGTLVTKRHAMQRCIRQRSDGSGSSRHLSGERGGVDGALVLELEEQAIRVRGGELGDEPDRPLLAAPVRARSLLGMDVKERQVSLPQGHQVATGTEVALCRDRPTPARDRERQLGLLTCL